MDRRKSTRPAPADSALTGSTAAAPLPALSGAPSPPAPGTAPAKRVLYVDDVLTRAEQARDAFRSLRADWHLVFTRSSQEAVALMDQSPFDAVITEMQMEQANGVEVLNMVMRRHPRTLRILRCTENEVELTRSCLGSPPYLLPRFCDLETLESVLTRAFQIEAWMGDEPLKNLYARLTTLPTLPTLYNQVIAELQSPKGSLEFVARLISKDPVMTAKMLQLVNSASIALHRQITDTVEAVMLLGAERVKSLILLSQVFTQFDKAKCPGFLVEPLWMHSMGTGAKSMAITMAETRDARMGEMAFTAGLLHDVGMLLLAGNLPTQYSLVVKQAAARRVNVRAVELEIFGASHAEVGACLLGIWGLPLPILEAIAWHHEPRQSRDTAFSLLTAVHVANALEYELKARPSDTPLVGVDTAYLERLGLLDRWDAWRQLCGMPSRPSAFATAA